jgi:DNA-binding MarR family transcriptional regulator
MLKTPHPLNPIVELIDELVRVNGRLRSLFAKLNAQYGLLAMETTVLTAVVEAHSPPTVPQIGRSLGNPRQVIQRAANALIAAGLIETALNPHHKRAPLLLATRKGKLLKHKADALASEATNALLRSISATKCRRIAGEVRELRIEIEAYLRSEKAKK